MNSIKCHIELKGKNKKFIKFYTFHFFQFYTRATRLLKFLIFGNGLNSLKITF